MAYIHIRGNTIRYSDFAIHCIIRSRSSCYRNRVECAGFYTETRFASLQKHGCSMASISDYAAPTWEVFSLWSPTRNRNATDAPGVDGVCHYYNLLVPIDPLFTLSWALKASQDPVVGAATALCTRLVARGGIYHPVLSPAVSSPSNRLKLGGCGPR